MQTWFPYSEIPRDQLDKEKCQQSKLQECFLVSPKETDIENPTLTCVQKCPHPGQHWCSFSLFLCASQMAINGILTPGRTNWELVTLLQQPMTYGKNKHKLPRLSELYFWIILDTNEIFYRCSCIKENFSFNSTNVLSCKTKCSEI